MKIRKGHIRLKMIFLAPSLNQKKNMICPHTESMMVTYMREQRQGQEMLKSKKMGMRLMEMKTRKMAMRMEELEMKRKETDLQKSKSSTPKVMSPEPKNSQGHAS